MPTEKILVTQEEVRYSLVVSVVVLVERSELFSVENGDTSVIEEVSVFWLYISVCMIGVKVVASSVTDERVLGS